MWPAHAEAPPERGTVSLKYLDYLDSQPGSDRIKVGATALGVSAPINSTWSFDGSLISDVISGASPAYYTATRSFSNIIDRRRAVDVNLTHYALDMSFKVGLSASNESDYESRALSAQISLPSDDRNTTYKFGVGLTKDNIQSNIDKTLSENKTTVDWMAGVTQVFTPNDIGQLIATYVNGQGFFTDPYKLLDNRPRVKQIKTLLGRWNHFFSGSENTLRLSYRYYTDSNDVRAHTVISELAFAPIAGFALTPLVRFYTQTAANFFVPPDPAFPNRVNIPEDYAPGVSYLSFDPRVSAFRGLTLGLKITKKIDEDWSIDLKVERYEQRPTSEGLANFGARTLQIGVTRQF